MSNRRHLKEITAVMILPNFKTIIFDNMIIRISRVLIQQHEAVIGFRSLGNLKGLFKDHKVIKPV